MNAYEWAIVAVSIAGWVGLLLAIRADQRRLERKSDEIAERIEYRLADYRDDATAIGDSTGFGGPVGGGGS